MIAVKRLLVQSIGVSDNPSCIFAVEESYGGPIALKRFVKAVHGAGIGVILDVVYNHFGPSDLDLWQFDGWSENCLGGLSTGNSRKRYLASEVQ